MFLTACQVLRALVRSVSLMGVALCCKPESLPLDVHDSMCTSVSEAASTALHCGRGQTIGKHLGLLVDPSDSCSAQQATLQGSGSEGVHSDSHRSDDHNPNNSYMCQQTEPN